MEGRSVVTDKDLTAVLTPISDEPLETIQEAPHIIEDNPEDFSHNISLFSKIHAIFDRILPFLPWITGIVFIIALFMLWRMLHHISMFQVLNQINSLPFITIISAIGTTAISFSSFAGYDWTASRYVLSPLPVARAALGGCCAYAVSGVVGGSFISGGAIRYRIYSPYGLTPGQIAGLTVFSTLGFSIAVHLVVVLVAVSAPNEFAVLLGVSPGFILTAAIGVASVIIAVALIIWCGRVQKEDKSWVFFTQIGRWRLRVPNPTLCALEILFSVTDIVAAASTCWILLPAGVVDFVPFVAIFVIALILGLSSHVPGGLGVFEGVMLAALGDRILPEVLTATLILYRFIYTLLPLVIALLVLFSLEGRRAWRSGSAFARRFQVTGLELLPDLAAVGAFLSGLILLIFAAAQTNVTSYTAHLATSLVGALLITAADGLRHRLFRAWVMTIFFLGISVALFVINSTFWGAIFLFAVLLAILPFRSSFNRPTALFIPPYATSTVVGMVGAVAGTALITAFSHGHNYIAHQTWWEAVTRYETPPAVRAALVMIPLGIILVLRQIIRPSQVGLALPSATVWGQAANIVRTYSSEQPFGLFVLRKDQSILFHPEGDAFMMYGKGGRGIVSPFGPIGRPGCEVILLWKFRDLAARMGCHPITYRVGPGLLPLANEVGLIAFPQGPEARLDLITILDADDERRACLDQLVEPLRQGHLRLDIIPAPVPIDLLNGHLAHLSPSGLLIRMVSAFPLAILYAGSKSIAAVAIVGNNTGAVALAHACYGTDPRKRKNRAILIAALVYRLRQDGATTMWPGLFGPLLPDISTHRLWKPTPAGDYKLENWRRGGVGDWDDLFQLTWEPRYILTLPGVRPKQVGADIARMIRSLR